MEVKMIFLSLNS